MDRVILHCDMDNYYASVECKLQPSLGRQCVAVCGNTAERHGIVLAKNQRAKQKGVKTGDPIWKAKMNCPELVVVPPHFSEYLKYSRLAKAIYYRFTDLVEPFGLDECWLDVTGSVKLFGSGQQIAQRIRRAVQKELGLTVSVGVSFNKIFAKLGSDLNKPDGLSVISRKDFREVTADLPVESLLGVGRATRKKLDLLGVHTIGELAQTPLEWLQDHLGKAGTVLWRYANGMDYSRVMEFEEKSPIKSIGHGVTTVEDLHTDKEVWAVLLELAQEVGEKMRKNHCAAGGVQIAVRNRMMQTVEFQTVLPYPMQSALPLAKQAYTLFRRRYTWKLPIRAITIRAISLRPETAPKQLDLFSDATILEKIEKIDQAVDTIRTRYGKRAVRNAVLLGDHKLPDGESLNALTGAADQSL